MTEDENFVFFYGGPFSQWWRSVFLVDNIEWACAEQFMMAQKALLFKDQETYRKIRRTRRPSEHKALGRQVKGFDEETWQGSARDIVYRGNVAKFKQNSQLRTALLATGQKVLVEASPSDRIWGIGLSEESPLARDPTTWRGTNWLGYTLMKVRDTLQADEGL